MPADYFRNTIRLQLCSLLEEDALKDATIVLREGICKEISLHDVEAERLLKLLQFACGKEGVVAEDIEEMHELGELADRLQMTAVRAEIEDKISKELSVENCIDMIQRNEASGLGLLQKQCYKMLRDDFEVISQKDEFLKLSEETMGALLEEDHLGVNREEVVFEAAVRWMSDSNDGIRGAGLLRKIRYGVLRNEYLTGLLASESLPGHRMVKELVGEAMAKQGSSVGEGTWDGVERLCDRWKVARVVNGRIIGADVLKRPRFIAMDGQGRIVVSDDVFHEIIIVNLDGTVARRFGSKGASAGQFDKPMGVAVDLQGHIIVADCGNHRIQVLNANGSVVRCFGSCGTAVGRLNHPCGVAIDGEGHIVVSDFWNNRIQVFDADGSVLRYFGSKGAAVGQLNGPAGVAVDGAGRIVVVDEMNHRVQVFNGDGTVAQCFGSEGHRPGQLRNPEDVAVDSSGRYVVSDTTNQRLQVFNSDGSVSHVLGSFGHGVGRLELPYGVLVDKNSGRIIVAEGGCHHRVQVFCEGPA